MSSKAKRRGAAAEWDALAKRGLPERGWALPLRLLAVLSSNILVGYLVMTGRARPFDVLLLVGIEALLLTLVEAAQLWRIPSGDVPSELRRPLLPRLGMLLFCLVALLFMNALLLLGLTGSGDALLAYWRQPLSSLAQAQLQWPLAITFGIALIDAVRDARHYTAHGGYFVSTPGWDGRARWLTLCLGPIPHAIPILAILWTIGRYFHRLAEHRRTGGPPPSSGLTLLTLAVLCLALIGFFGWLVKAGLSGWVVGFCTAKLTSEALIVCLPLTAAKRRDEEAPAE